MLGVWLLSSQSIPADDRKTPDSSESPNQPQSEPVPRDPKQPLRVMGQVVNESGELVEDALLVLTLRYDKVAQKSIDLQSRSDERGEFQFAFQREDLGDEVDALYPILCGWHPKQGVGAGPFQRLSFSAPNSIRMVLSAPVKRRFRILDERQRPVADARVAPDTLLVPYLSPGPNSPPGHYVSIPDDIRKELEQRGDTHGRVEIACPADDEMCCVQVDAANYTSQRFTMSPVADQNHLDLVLAEMASIEGSVQPAVGPISLTLMSSGSGRGYSTSVHERVTTDDQGRFRVPRFPVGDVRIHADLRASLFLVRQEVTLAPGANELSLRLVRGVPVHGRVVLANHADVVPQARVSVESHGDFATRGHGGRSTVADETGWFTTFAMPGSATVHVSSPAGEAPSGFYSKPASVKIPTDHSGAYALPDLVVEPAAVWRGKLIDEHNQPIAGVHVGPLVSGYKLDRGPLTNANGEFATQTRSYVTLSGWQAVWLQNGREVHAAETRTLSHDPLVLQVTRFTPSAGTPSVEK